MTEVKYSTHVFDLSIERIDIPIDLSGGSINVIAIDGDCFIKFNDKSQDPINLLHATNIKTEFTKFYLSNNVHVGGYVAIIVGNHCEFELSTNITRKTYTPIPLPFQNIPQHLKERVIDRPEIINIWDIENATFVHSFDTSQQTDNLRGIFINPDGLKLYIIGRVTVNQVLVGRIHEYDLSRAWDISTAIYKHSFSITAQTTNPFGLFFNPNGTAAFCIGHGIHNNIFKYTLSIPWDISTATYNTSVIIPDAVNHPFDLFISPNGHKLYIVDILNNKITEFNLTTAWDITTAVFYQSLNISHKITHPRAIFLTPDGLCFYVVGHSPREVIAFRILKAWDITTGVFRQSFNYDLIMSQPASLLFKCDGTKMFIGSTANNRIYEFDL